MNLGPLTYPTYGISRVLMDETYFEARPTRLHRALEGCETDLLLQITPLTD
jgi:hypothetical protein